MRLGLSALVLALAACSTTPPAPTANSAPEASPTAALPPTAVPTTSAPPTETAVPSAEPTPAPPSPSATLAAPPIEAPPLPTVKVVNIGMHIGGGPNDNATKEPIRRSVEPHFNALRACFGKLDDQSKGGDFGIDLLIERDGGKPRTSHPRTALKGKPFEECVVQVFDAIEFLKPKTGKTMVSYSLRFTP